ncbi:MAG: NAD(P)-dependent alcohol dehydrogenase [Sandaracinaceae bacterium]
MLFVRLDIGPRLWRLLVSCSRAKMKAIVCSGYGSADRLQLQEVDRPSPRVDQVRVRIGASTVTSGDVRIRRSDYAAWFWPLGRAMFGLIRPRAAVPGSEFAGVVESMGSRVTRFRVGDRVFGLPWTLGFGAANAEYICVPEDGMVAAVPPNTSLEDAAGLPVGGLTALFLLRAAEVRRGHRVLVVGASGSVGTFVVQLAKHLGAHVTGVCRGANVDLVASLGADHVIDYTKEDFTQRGEVYDVVVDAVMKAPWSRSRRALRRHGVFATVDWPLLDAVRSRWTMGPRIVFGTAPREPGDLELLAELCESGSVRVVIDRRYPLAGTSKAHAYVETGRKRGNVILTVDATLR